MIKMKYNFNLELLNDYSDVKHHIKSPMLAVFEFDDKKLLYLGTKHNLKGSRSLKTFYAINYCFDNFDIDFIVTECAHSNKLIDYKNTFGAPDMNELIYAPLIGSQRKIKYTFIDSDEKDWFKDVVAVNKENIKMMQCFFMLNDAYKYKQAFGKNFSIQNAIDNVVYKFWKKTYPEPMNKQEFQKFFKKHFDFGVFDKNLSDILMENPDWNEPNISGNINNKAWSYINIYSRDIRMLKGIFNAINKYKCVLVTIGAGHFDNQRRVLEDAFGKPKFFYNFPRSIRQDTKIQK